MEPIKRSILIYKRLKILDYSSFRRIQTASKIPNLISNSLF